MDVKKKILPALFVAVWMTLLLLLAGFYLLFAPRQSNYAPEENRMLAPFPTITAQSLLSGQFGEEVENYLLDRFPGRNYMISATNVIQSRLSFASFDDYLLVAEGVEDPLDHTGDLGEMDELLASLAQPDTEPPRIPEETTAVTEPEATESTEPTEPVENPPIEAKPPANLEDFPDELGTYMDIGSGENRVLHYYRKNVAALTAVLNKYAALLPENGKLMFTVGPPSYVVNRFVNAEEKVRFYHTWDEMVNAFGSDNVYAFDSAQILADAIKEGKYVSFRTDNHWTPYGAYLIYRQMAAQAGKELCDYTADFDITVEEGFRGTYYRDNPAAYMNVEPDTLELLMPKIPVEYRRITGPDAYEVMDFLDFDAVRNDRYTVYLGGPGGPWRYVECDNGETENCLVITDSFGLTVIPFLTSNYKQIHYYDSRYYKESKVGYTVAEMMEKYNIHDVYVIVADFHSFSSDFIINKANWNLGIS